MRLSACLTCRKMQSPCCSMPASKFLSCSYARPCSRTRKVTCVNLACAHFSKTISPSCFACAVMQTLDKHGVQAGQEHIWDFLSSKANRQAVSNAGPLQLKNKAERALDEFEEVYRQLTWWKLDYGPDVESLSPVDRLGKHFNSFVQHRLLCLFRRNALVIRMSCIRATLHPSLSNNRRCALRF